MAKILFYEVNKNLDSTGKEKLLLTSGIRRGAEHIAHTLGGKANQGIVTMPDGKKWFGQYISK